VSEREREGGRERARSLRAHCIVVQVSEVLYVTYDVSACLCFLNCVCRSGREVVSLLLELRILGERPARRCC
jgi:hypothetical protein